jgi:hypothetical protein
MRTIGCVEKFWSFLAVAETVRSTELATPCVRVTEDVAEEMPVAAKLTE